MYRAMLRRSIKVLMPLSLASSHSYARTYLSNFLACVLHAYIQKLRDTLESTELGFHPMEQTKHAFGGMHSKIIQGPHSH